MGTRSATVLLNVNCGSAMKASPMSRKFDGLMQSCRNQKTLANLSRAMSQWLQIKDKQDGAMLALCRQFVLLVETWLMETSNLYC